MDFTKNKNFSVICLAIFCVCMFFAFLGSYPLIDVDETRYVRIAQEMFNGNNFLTPIINGELFLEKPPLFFWLEDFSFWIFHSVNEISARIPMAVVATIGVYSTFFIGKKLISERFGLIAALVLGSNVLYIILSHIAILDLLLSVTMMISAYCGILTLFFKGKINQILWFCFYLFCGLSILAKGIPGFVVPFMLTFFAYLFTKNLKELFNFKKIGLGFILLLLVVLPWHLMMYKVHGQMFIDEYIIKHHIARFFSSEGINRKEPFWFFIPVILVGFIPFIFPLSVVCVSEIKKYFQNFKNGFKYNIFNYFLPDNGIKKIFLNLNIMSAFFIFLFFSASSTKLPTYILPVMFPLSFVIAYIFDENFNNKKFDTEIKISNIILISIFLLASITALIALFIKIDVLIELRPILISGFILFFTYSIFNVKMLNAEKKYFFSTTVIFMVLLTFILNLQIFNFVVSFGEGDLINYSKIARQEQKKLATFNFGERYSTIFYYGNHVEMKDEADYEWFNNKLKNDYYVILKNKNIVDMPSEIKAAFKVIETGKKYSLVEKTNEI